MSSDLMKPTLPHRVLLSGLVFLFSTSLGAQTPWVWNGQPWADNRPFMSTITSEVKAHLQEVLAAGVIEERVVGRMGQIGDSITHSSAFFRNTLLVGPDNNETGHNYAMIRSWLAYSGDQPADANSFYRDYGKDVPYGNFGGWTIEDAVGAGHPFVAVDVGDGVVPGEFSWALVMFGTNDIDDPDWEPLIWSQDLAAFVQDFEDLGVIPVLSTIPPEAAHLGDGRVEEANQQIRELASNLDLPLVDYYRLILHHQPDNWHGTLIGPDGTHPSAGGGGNDFSQDGLTTSDGYAARTKLALDMAEKVMAIVFNDGEPEPLFYDDFESGHLGSWTLPED